jgi:hypothetical protein
LIPCKCNGIVTGEEDFVPYACSYEVPGDEDIYAKVKAEIGDDVPDGLVLQLVTRRGEGGLRHVTVWESKEQFERFQRERVGPAVGKVLAGMGITEAPPRPPVSELDLVDAIVAPA